MGKITILVINSPSLARAVDHLFRDRSEFAVVGSSSELGSLEPRTRELLPELIVANLKPVSEEIGRTVASIKKSNPLSRLILICPVEGLARAARRCGADACLNDEKLADHLLRTARTLSELPKLANASS